MKGSGKPSRQHVTPSIDLGVRVKREWRTIPVMDVREGDTVSGVGLITATGRRHVGGDRTTIKAVLLENTIEEFSEHEPTAEVFAFVRADG